MKKFFYLSIFLFFISSCNEKGEDISFEENSVKGSSDFFRVGQTSEGQWWFIDPEGKPFFYKGVCAINRAGTQGGRRATPGKYAEAVDRKYNYMENPDTFVYSTINRLRDWGFNGLGAWTTEEFFDKGMAYTEILEFFKEGPFMALDGQRHSIPDIFSDEWKVAIDKKARALCSPLRNSKQLLGYFTDNEIGFGATSDFGLDPGFKNAGRFGFSLLRQLLSAEENQPATIAAWNFLMERHQNLTRLGEAWNLPEISHEHLRKMNQELIPIESEQYQEDSEDFSAFFASTYFQLVNEAIKRYDPNHLILGCRFGGPPDEFILQAMKPWVDVISQNNYRAVMYERIDYLYRSVGLPVLIGEFSWNTDIIKKVPLHNEPENGLTLKQRMYKRGERILEQAITHPAMVGYTWYRWVQPPSTDEKFTDGLVDYDDETDMHVEVLKEINPRIDSIRMNHKEVNISEGTHYGNLLFEDVRGNDIPVLEMKVENGVLKDTLYGWQSTGKLVNSETDSSSMEFTVQVEYHTWQFRDRVIMGGSGEYHILLQKEDGRWEGEYIGTYRDNPVTGKALAYFY